MAELHIPPLAAETVFHIGPVPITNTIINSWLAMVIFLVAGLTVYKRIKFRPGRIQIFAEYIIEILFGYFDLCILNIDYEF